MHNICYLASMKFLYTLLLPVLLLSACANIKAPEFKGIEKFGVRQVTLQSATLGFDVAYFNPNNFGVTVKDAQVDVYLDSVYLGKFNQEQDVSVYQNTVFSIPFTGNISLLNAMNLKPGQWGSRPILLKAEGSVKVGKAGIFVTRPISYEGRHSLNEISVQIK